MTPFNLIIRPDKCLINFLCKFCTLLLYIVFSVSSLSAQEFTLSVTVTNETCPGNGKLNFTVQNADSSAPVNYKVYLLPNTTTAIYNNTTPSVNSLVDGNYLVVATQTVNGSTVTDEEEVTIDDETVSLQYNVTGTPTDCGDDGEIIINVTQGNPQTYEVLTGPETRPVQSDNVFAQMPSGTYTVRVTDNCGEGIVRTYTVISNESIATIGPAFFPDTTLPACDLITAAHDVSTIDPDLDLAVPLQITYTVYPPDSSDPFVYTQTSMNGEISQIIPFYYDTDYYYDIEVIDDCDRIYTLTNNLVRQKLNVIAGFDNANCGNKFLLIEVFKYRAPFTLTFTNTPDGFDPEALNAMHPGPFFDNELEYGDDENPVPFGIYEFTVIDECDRSVSVSVEIVEDEEVEALSTTYNNDCANNLGVAEIIVPGYVLVGGNILTAPGTYTETLPYDLSDNVNDDDNVEIGELPPGEYEFEVIDDCGNVYPIDVTIPNFVAPATTYNVRPDCTEGFGTIRIGGGIPLTEAFITAAPSAFTETLPYDILGFSDDSGTVYLDGLPPGSYTFNVANNCESTTTTINATVTAYTVTSNDIFETRNCGTFDVTIAHQSNGVAFVKFWLQKLIGPDTDSWGHPLTNVIYDEGTTPTLDNSKQLDNNTTTLNIPSTGVFRIVKSFRTFGSSENRKDCFEILYDFEFFDDLVITDINSLTCSGDDGDVEVTAVGAEPLNYKIISKNGDTSFQIDNGTNNIFSGLESALYEVRVDDPCGNFDTQPFNVADLPSIVNATTPEDIERCDEGDENTEIFDISIQDAIILGTQSTDDVTLTYHNSLNDAEQGINAIDTTITTDIGNEDIYARVTRNDNEECFVITSFSLIVRALPNLQLDETAALCENSNITIGTGAGFESYLWSTDEITRTITVSEPGSYTLTVTNEYGCEAEATIEVVESEIPVISGFNISDWTNNNNIITVLLDNTSDLSNYEYSLDGINYQDSNTFTELEPGQYDIYVRDKFECGTDSGSAYLLTYPKFFTPNGDGVNEKWRIKFSAAEPNLYVYIFDRFGKVITGFGAGSEGWDGTYNGVTLPSTDYWFVVIRENGKEYKGHFAMVR